MPAPGFLLREIVGQSLKGIFHNFATFQDEKSSQEEDTTRPKDVTCDFRFKEGVYKPNGSQI